MSVEPQQLFSIEQVADVLGLHVKTVRNYVRDGRLKAVRIGKQYRIARDDLEALTGGAGPVPGHDAGRDRHTEVSSIVQIDAISPEAMSRVSNTVMAAAGGRPHDGEHLRIQTVYDQQRATMKVIVLGGLEATAELLKVIAILVEEQP